MSRKNSNFSLSNATDDECRKSNNVIIGQQDLVIGNLSNDDITVDDGKSTEGLGERNNPFAAQIYSMKVDNEQSPSKPIPQQFVIPN